LGCVFYEMLTGKPPLKMSKDRHQRALRRRFEEVQTLRPGEIDAPAAVYALCDTMLAFDPKRRYQTPGQLVDAIKAASRDQRPLTGSSATPAPAKPVAKSIYLAEGDQRLGETLREKFKEMGFRVFLATDPARALDRFRQQPYDAVVIDAGTVGEDGLIVFDSLLREANDRRLPLSGILVLSEEQAGWADRITPRKNAAVLVRPIGMKQLRRKLLELSNGK
jgi:serine/threonine-protein kinase